MEKINVDFGNILQELKNKNLKIFFKKNVYGENVGIFIENNQKDIYQIEDYRHGSYLDELIKNKIVVKFNQIDSNIIKEWEKEVWDIPDIEAFIKRQNL